MERIKQIVKQLIDIAKQFNLSDLSQDCLFENSIKIYLSEVIQENKQNNIKAYQNKPESKPVDKPSEKQIDLLKKFKIKDIDKLTKQDATQLIKQKIQEQKDKQNEY